MLPPKSVHCSIVPHFEVLPNLGPCPKFVADDIGKDIHICGHQKTQWVFDFHQFCGVLM